MDLKNTTWKFMPYFENMLMSISPIILRILCVEISVAIYSINRLPYYFKSFKDIIKYNSVTLFTNTCSHSTNLAIRVFVWRSKIGSMFLNIETNENQHNY